MGRTKGVKNKDGHKAGGARKGSGRKPKSVEDGSKKQMTSSSRTHATRLSRKSSTKLNSHDDRLANILPASTPSSTTQHDPHAQSYKIINSNTSPGGYSLATCSPTSSTDVACSPLPIQLTSNESFHVSPANPWSAEENINIQTDSEFTNHEIGAIEQPMLSYPAINMTQPQLAVDHMSTYTPISSPMCSPTLDSSYSQLEMNYWNAHRNTGVTGGMSASFTDANSGMPYCSPTLSYSPCSPYMWSGSQMTLSPSSHESPASSYSSLESPITNSPSISQTTKSRRRPRRCAVCLTYGEDINALACPGRGDRNRCPHSRVYDTHAVPHGDTAENFYFQQGQAPIPHEDLNIYSNKYADDTTVNLCPPFAVTTIENPPRRPRHCKICTTTGRSGTTCPGRGNRALCPDFTFKREDQN